MQNKSIIITTYDDESIKETPILQEHKMGSKVYTLSLIPPIKP